MPCQGSLSFEAQAHGLWAHNLKFSAVMTLSSFPELRMWFRMGDTNATSRSGDLACSFFIAYLLTYAHVHASPGFLSLPS